MNKIIEIWNTIFTPKKYTFSIETSKDSVVYEVGIKPANVEPKQKVKLDSVWRSDTRTKLTPEQSNKMEMVMGNNWERTSAYLGIIAKEFRK